jgi:hypothetical protein
MEKEKMHAAIVASSEEVRSPSLLASDDRARFDDKGSSTVFKAPLGIVRPHWAPTSTILVWSTDAKTAVYILPYDLQQ